MGKRNVVFCDYVNGQGMPCSINAVTLDKCIFCAMDFCGNHGVDLKAHFSIGQAVAITNTIGPVCQKCIEVLKTNKPSAHARTVLHEMLDTPTAYVRQELHTVIAKRALEKTPDNGNL